MIGVPNTSPRYWNKLSGTLQPVAEEEEAGSKDASDRCILEQTQSFSPWLIVVSFALITEAFYTAWSAVSCSSW